MNKLFLFVFFLIAPLGVQAQNEEPADELSKLKKQVSELKAKTVKLDKTLKYSATQMGKLVDSLRNELDSGNLQLAAMQDSLTAKERIIRGTRGATFVLFKSLKHRKKLFITWFCIGIVLLAGISLWLVWKYKADRKNLLSKLNLLMQQMKDESEKLKNDSQSQINAARDGLDQKISELSKKLMDQEKKISELKK